MCINRFDLLISRIASKQTFIAEKFSVKNDSSKFDFPLVPFDM